MKNIDYLPWYLIELMFFLQLPISAITYGKKEINKG